MNKYQNIADREVKRISEIDQKRNVVDRRLQLLRNNLCREAMEWAVSDENLSSLEQRLSRTFNLPMFGKYKDKQMYRSAVALGKELRIRYTQDKKVFGERQANHLLLNHTTQSSHIKAMNREKYRVGNKFETKRKKENLNNMIQESREQEVPVIFYLASSHTKPAKDHKAFQGKMYVDKNWKSILDSAGIDERIVKKVQTYIQRNNIQTVQWVTGEPVYFIFRPFCKHYFVPIPTRKALDTPKTKLIFLSRASSSSALEDRKNRQGNGTRKEINAREWEKRIEFTKGLSNSSELPVETLRSIDQLKRKQMSYYKYRKKSN